MENLQPLIKRAFNEWGHESQYVTGSWLDGETVDKPGEYWEFYNKNAWEQFCVYWDKYVTGTKIN